MPEPTPAVPTPTPAPAPAPAAPKPAPTPAPAAKEPVRDMEPNIFDEIDARLNPKPKPAEPPKVAEPDEPDAPPEPDAPEPDKPVVKAEDKDKRSLIPKFAREQIAKTNAELKAAKEAFAAKEARLAELEGGSKETTTLAERLAAVEKERDEALAEARGLKQEVSPEFKERFEKPFERAANEAKRFVDQLTVVDQDGSQRKATWEQDFAALYALPEIKAVEAAEALFGKHAPRVMARYDELHRLSSIADEARESEKANWKQTQSQNEARSIQQREASQAALGIVEKALKTKYAEWYGDDPADPEGNALVAQMDAKLNQKPKSMAEWAERTTRIKLNATMFPRLVHRLNKAKDEIAALKTKLEERDKGLPGGTKRVGDAPAPKKGDFITDLANEVRNMR